MRNRQRYSLLIAGFIVCFTCTVFGNEQFDKANAAYNQKEYDKAVVLYEKLVEEGYTGAILYYNLGNACFKDNQLAKALLWYERALRLDPGNEDIRHNIAFANQQTTDKTEVQPDFFLKTGFNAIRDLFPLKVWTILSIVLLAVACICIAFMLILSRWRMGLFCTSCVLILFTVLSILFAGLQLHNRNRNDEAIVMRKILTVKSTPDASGTDLFTIHEGIKVRITDKAGNWIEVRLPQGDKGWIPQDAAEVI
ncbi:MAG: tetratricopeptide repeat protein [Bacteroidales bacterium]|jgi:tetratricopeptide (TPR) repeat protein|nr:tetratricopeptide repeat protein [Bacteroidales bacterium]